MSTHHTTGDVPQITSSVYGASSTYEPTVTSAGGGLIWGGQLAAASLAEETEELDTLDVDKLLRRARQEARQSHQQHQTTDPMPDKPTRRLVQVFIADPDPNVPLKAALLYKGELMFTDATDQELYFEVPLLDLLTKHNTARAGWLDREATKRAGKDIFLEPVKIRDLRMVVVNVASF